jgi:hypothetical protein
MSSTLNWSLKCWSSNKKHDALKNNAQKLRKLTIEQMAIQSTDNKGG